MRLRRLVFEWDGGDPIALELHPHLTVVAGMDEPAREALAGDILAAMAGSGRGVRAELEGVAPRDVPALLHALGLDQAEGQRVARFRPTDAREVDRSRDAAITTLAAADQGRLWAAAAALGRAEERLQQTIDDGDQGVDLDDLAELVDARHAARQAAAARFELVRRASFYVSGFCGLVTLPAVLAVGSAGLALAAGAMAGAVASIVAWRRLVGAQAAERDALHAAGADSYQGFAVSRRATRTSDAMQRLAAAADAHRAALSAWHRLAGVADVDWALQHRDEIEAAAVLRTGICTMDAFAHDGEEAAHVSEELAGAADDELVHALVRRLAEARRHRGEGVPLVLVEPFVGLDPRLKPFVLELISQADGHPQIIVLTGDEDVASWARLEVLTGEVSVIEPQGASTVV
jgi:hypothetical protein